ncbi:unnamed protein product [Allacma fusca]|uniref:ATP-binding cassette sub-family B member 6 n=1 Tax=Allacma fusca TaxID=39272 RepID=A0A8J2LG71_9HEXA|nr:unnamed protein product [Allacma fusca]
MGIQYCPPNITLSEVWVNNGLSVCFMDTVISATSLGFILLFGCIQLFFYRKYATVVEHYALPYSQLFGLQMVLCGLMPALGILRFTLQALIFEPGMIYGYMILYLLNSIIVWPFVCLLIVRERNYMLPSVPTKGHGLVLLIFWTGNFVAQNLILLNIKNPGWFFKFENAKDIIQFSLFLSQYLASGVVFILGLKAPGIPSIRHSDSFSRLHPFGDDEENSSSRSPFSNFWAKSKALVPFIWPSKSFKLQIYVIVCVISVVAGRVTNVYVPLYSKYIVDSLTTNVNASSNLSSPKRYYVGLTFEDLHLAFRWDFVLIYVALKVIQGGGAGTSGLLSNLRSFLWISVSQYTTREVQVKFFGHLHRLSLRWHLQRKTGEVLRAMDRGTESVNNILNYLIFNIVPTVADIIIAIVYFAVFFNGWFGLIVFVTMVVYLAITFIITEWRTKFRRTMNQADNEQRQQAVDSLLNFETVKYYANEEFEISRYGRSIRKYQREEWKVNASVSLLNMIQLFIINIGLLVGSLLCVKMIVNHEAGLTAGDYVLFTSYLMQLYTPLNFFGTYYRVLQRCFIDMENMMDLFKQEAEINDEPGAEDLQIRDAHIEFKDVCFNYVPERQVLDNISFSVPPGHTVALVGPSGAGKTSIIRLLFRFYDPTSGEISIDGQNIKHVTQASLRKAVGVVPQDTVLFNDTIQYNIKYGRIESDDADMIEASRGAHIHDKICTFPQRYDTTVGERGLKLMAHRLSTVIHANNIIVLSSEGQITEQGSHDDLLARNGLYASMWNEQLKASDSNEASNSKQEEE